MSNATKNLHVYKHNDLIFVIKLDSLSRQACDEFETYIMRLSGQFASPLCVLYDLSECGLPSQAFFTMHEKLSQKLVTPDETYAAYWVPQGPAGHILKRAFQNVAGTLNKAYAIFTDKDAAIAWLTVCVEEA